MRQEQLPEELQQSTLALRAANYMVEHVVRHARHQRDEFPAYPLLGVAAVACVAARRNIETGELWGIVREEAKEALATDGIEVEFYARRGDMGNGPEDSRARVLVVKRDGVKTEVQRKPLGAYDQYVTYY